MADPTFCIDTCSLITPWRDWYRPGKFPSVWALVDELIDGGTLIAPKDVLSEINKQEDDLAAWVNARKHMFLELNESAQAHLTRLGAEYHPRFSPDPGDDIWADLAVIALALADDREVMVVTEENPSGGPDRLKIPDVCEREGLDPIKFADMLDYFEHGF